MAITLDSLTDETPRTRAEHSKALTRRKDGERAAITTTLWVVQQSNCEGCEGCEGGMCSEKRSFDAGQWRLEAWTKPEPRTKTTTKPNNGSSGDREPEQRQPKHSVQTVATQDPEQRGQSKRWSSKGRDIKEGRQTYRRGAYSQT